MKFSISWVKVRREHRYMLSYKPAGGKRVRRFYKARKDAERERDAQQKLLNKAGEAWLAMTADERNEVVTLIIESRRSGFTLRQAVESYRQAGAA